MRDLSVGGRAVSRGEIPGFASPPHDGFAFVETGRFGRGA